MNDTYSSRQVGLGITLVSAAMLMTEIILTRLFSVTIGFHFAFLAISVALFGIGAASLLVHVVQDRLSPALTESMLAYGAVVLGTVIVAADLVFILTPPNWNQGVSSYFATSTGHLFLAFCTAAAPFLVGGFVVSLAITRYSRSIHSIYFFDLVGAGAGCLLVIPALQLLGAPLALVLVAAVAAAGGLAFSRGATARGGIVLGWAPPTAIAVLLALIAVEPITDLFRIRAAKGRDLTEEYVEFNRWNSFSMVTVLGAEPGESRRFPGWGLSHHYRGSLPDQKILLIDMGALTALTGFNGDLNSVDHLLHDLSAFAYHIRPEHTKEVCVLGAGGGRDVLSALSAGAEHVTGVEINPLIVEGVVRGDLRDFVGGIYDRPDVTILVDDGRGFIRSTDKKFDLIQISMIDTSAATAAGAYSLTESSLYTVEAFEDYMAHLKPGGLLSVAAVSAPVVDAGARLASMGWRVLRKIGADPALNVVAISTPWLHREHHTMRNVIVKKEPFTEDELKIVRQTSRRLGFQQSYLPGEPLAEASWIGRILHATSERDLARRISGWHLDVSPSTDDRPFFFYQNHLDDAWPIIGLGTTRHPKGVVGMGLPMLLGVAVVALGMAIVFLVVPFLLAREQVRTGKGRAAWDLGYVACLGLGFMFVEIALIQKFTLYLGFPSATLAVVLLVVLTSGAIGSRLFGRVPTQKRRRWLAAALVALAILLIALWQTGIAGTLLGATTGWPVTGRAALTALLLAPIGLLLGMPLPAGLFAVSSRAASRIPWLWAINSATSVLGSVSATIFSMHIGISFTLWIGIALYLLASLLSLRVTASS